MRKRNVRAAIAAALCMTVLAAGCGKKADDPVFTGDKTETPVYQANLDAIKSSAYASVDNLDPVHCIILLPYHFLNSPVLY